MARQNLSKRPTVDEGSVDEITISASTSSAYEQHDDRAHPHLVAPHEKSQEEDSRTKRVATEPLHRQGYIIYLVLFYSAMLCTAWFILVLTSRHPLGRSSYGCFDSNNYCRENSEDLALQNERTSRYIRNAQTLLSAVSLLTIPLTSAVCAAAVVPWLQQSGQDMSLRQIMTLSDKGWTSPYVYYRLLRPAGWRRYGSSFIALALLLHALGAALSPAINQMSALVPIKVPKSSTAPTVPVISLYRLFNSSYQGPPNILQLRESLKTVDPTHIRPRIWVPKKMDCSITGLWRPDRGSYLPNSTQCTNGGMTYLSLTTEPEAWISQLRSDFSTGVKQSQYVPRINTSVEVELLNELPTECNTLDAALLINYAGSSIDKDGNDTLIFDWSVRVCIPEYPSRAFNDTDDAQTLIETAYFDLYTYNIMDRYYHNISKITMSTTAGYFELPNYNSKNAPGPLMQYFTSSTQPDRQYPRRSMPNYAISLEKNATQKNPDLEIMPNSGPLVNIIYALFGNGSLPSIYSNENATYNPGVPVLGNKGNQLPCVDLVPLYALAHAYSPNNGSSYDSRGNECLSYYDVALGDQMHFFISNLVLPTQALERVFRAAAYMYHEIWLSRPSVFTINVEYDAGQDLQKPGLNDRRIVALTIAIAVFLLSLLMLAVYASFSKTWTYSLDAHALLRIGAELGREALPFLVIRDAHHIGELDELPGWVGDVTGDEDITERKLGMAWNGKERQHVSPVKKDGVYLSYPEMQRRNGFEVFCLWCNTVCGLGGLRETKASLRVQKCSAWLRRIKMRVVAKVQEARAWMRQTRLRKRWDEWLKSYIYAVRYQTPIEENLAYRSVGQSSTV